MVSAPYKNDVIKNHSYTQPQTMDLKTKLSLFYKHLESLFPQQNISTLVGSLVSTIDEILLEISNHLQLLETNEFCILALGSYGRKELNLHSDIDLLILHEPNPSSIRKLEQFIQKCWDIGLEIGHQITTVEDCAELASQELTVISNILDMRFLCGNQRLMDELIYKTHSSQMWPSHHFYFEKQKEQLLRYKKYGETAYNLEPNVKSGPGGLRDIHTIFAVAKRHFGIQSLEEGIHSGFLTEMEYEELINCQHFLTRIRFALHLIAKKREDRLLFDYQLQLASLFGYEDTQESLAIEQFMKDYFKVIKRNRELNEIVLQWFEEVIILPSQQSIISLDEHFQLCNNYIEVKSPHLFAKEPSTLLALFLWLVKDPNILGVRANTIRLIHEHLEIMDENFKNNPQHNALFLSIFQQATSPFHALQRMSRYGVLGSYLNCFATVTGQMQYDLFHVYTVDQHTLFVIRNLGRFLDNRYAQQFPLAAKLMTTISKKEILYLAAFFHDIGKGRGGDHSQLGAKDALEFALIHQLDNQSKELLIWLVEHHLLMSLTAQRQDIYDPNNIKNFCNQLPHASYLDYLYLLTVADICATNPTLWNGWKDSLLKELYFAAQRYMEQSQSPKNEEELITFKKRDALQLILNQGYSLNTIENLWSSFKGKYFLHESPELIAEQTQAILSCKKYPLVLVFPHHSQGGTEVFIYSPHIDSRFTIATTVLSNHQITIQEANILTCDNGFDLDTYVVLDENNKPLDSRLLIDKLTKDLVSHLKHPLELPRITQRRISRTQAHFKLKPEIVFSKNKQQKNTCLFLKTSDRPGLLASISRIFFQEGIHLHNAKIATAGERVEDMFYISNNEGKPLVASEMSRLRKRLAEELGSSFLKKISE